MKNEKTKKCEVSNYLYMASKLLAARERRAGPAAPIIA